MNKLKKVIKIISGILISSTSVILSTTFPPFIILGIPLTISGFGISYDGFMKQDLKNTVFKVDNNKLVENPFKIGKSIGLILKKDKVRNFLNESINAFKQLKIYEKNEKITYKMETHGFVKKRLEELQQLGYLENVESKVQDNGKKKSFFLENLGMGNFKNLFKKKQKYDISFNLTGKSFDNNIIEINNYIDQIVDKKKKQNIYVINNENINQSEKSDKEIEINNLRKIREELLNSRQEDNTQRLGNIR